MPERSEEIKSELAGAIDFDRNVVVNDRWQILHAFSDIQYSSEYQYFRRYTSDYKNNKDSIFY